MRGLRTWLVLGLVLLALPTPAAPAHSDTGAPRVLSIVHLGDSYSAGNGIGNHHGPAPCLRSSHNWGSLLASWANSRGVATSYQNRACSGGNIDDLFSPRALPKQSAKEVAADSIEEARARLDETDVCSARAAGDDLLSVDYHLRESNGLSLWARKYTYECQLTVRAQTDFVGPRTDLVLLTAGGNELGFTDIIANCFGPRIPGALEGANGTRCREDVAATMAGLPEMLDRLKSQISRLITERMTGNPKSQVILLAYPLLSLDRPYHLPDGAVSYDAARGVRELGRAAIREQRRIIDELENDFPGRVKFIEEVADAFDGHEPDPRVFTRNKHRWINEFLETSGDHGQNGGISGPRSGSSTDWYHPNLAGHRRIAKLMQDPSNLAGARSATETPDSPAATLQGPYVGKIGENLMLDARASLPSRGRITRFEWDFDGDGTFDATTGDGHVLHNYPQQISGYVRVRVTDESGAQATTSALLDITRDGDTVPDEFDNCPEHPNPMQDDLDGDGVGDSCQDPATWGITAPLGSDEQAVTPPAEELPAPSLPRPPVLPASPGLPKTGKW